MSLIETLQIARTPILTVIAGFFSLAGNEIVFLCALGIIFWCMNKNVAYRIGFAYIIAGPVFFMVRGFAHVPRPWIRKATLSPVQIASLGAEGYSMPSAHTFNAAALGARFVTNSRILIAKASAVLLVILTAFSRIYLGLNTWLDVLISVVIVTAATIFSDYLIDNIRFDQSRNHIYAALLLIPTLLMMGITLSMYGYGTVDLENLAAAVNASGIYMGLIFAGFIDQSFIDFSVRCDYSWQQVLKALIGVFIILVVRGGISLLLKALFPHFLFGNFFCNLVSVLLAFGLYPMLINRYFTARYR